MNKVSSGKLIYTLETPKGHTNFTYQSIAHKQTSGEDGGYHRKGDQYDSPRYYHQDTLHGRERPHHHNYVRDNSRRNMLESDNNHTKATSSKMNHFAEDDDEEGDEQYYAL